MGWIKPENHLTLLFLKPLPEDDGGHNHQVQAHEEEARLYQGKAQ